MWAKDVTATRAKIANEEGKKNKSVTRKAGKLADKILLYLEKDKEYVMGMLEKHRGKITSDVLTTAYHDWMTIDTCPENNAICEEASKIISDTLGLQCFVYASYEYDLRKDNEDAVSFSLSLV
jgi:hypothetical protein